MISNPKDFYRKLDSFLSDIYRVGSDRILSTVLNELVDFFGKDLHVQNGSLYELDVEYFVLLHSVKVSNTNDISTRLNLHDPAVQQVLKHGSFIYNSPNEQLNHYLKSGKENLTTVAFTVQSDTEKWLFVFELAQGWDREEIEFAINTIRKVLNARISSESFRNSLHQAELIQRSLLPKGPIEIRGFEVAGESISTDIVGGDLFDIINFDDEHFGVAVGDASGHGLPAALLVRDVVTGLRMGLEKEMKITPVLEKLNRVIHKSTLSTSFISLFYGEIESNGNLVYANAGHPAPILVAGERLELLERGGLVLGPMPEVKLRRGFTYMNPGNVLVLFSDGLLERQNRFGVPFEIERVKQIVVDHQHRSAESIKSILIESALNFGDKSTWKDDVTVVVIKRNLEEK